MALTTNHQDPLGLCKGDRIDSLPHSLSSDPTALQRFTMFDDTDPSQIPSDATHCSYYADHPTVSNLNAVRRQCPHALLLPVVVFAVHPTPGTLHEYVGSEHGIECDCEPTDLTPPQVGPWAAGVKHQGGVPVVYADLAEIVACIASMNAHGLKRSDVKLHTAHWNFQAHICSGIGSVWGTINADATQWTDKFMGRNLDASLCEGNFFSPAPPPTQPRGLETGGWAFDYARGHWAITRDRRPGSLVFTEHPKEAKAEITLQMQNGDVSIAAK